MADDGFNLNDALSGPGGANTQQQQSHGFPSPWGPQNPAAGQPQYPGAPGQPQYPGAPGQPQYPGAPGQPQYPGAPGQPQYPGAPGQPQYPGAPGQPQYPGAPGQPQYPGAPGPGQQQFPGFPGPGQPFPGFPGPGQPFPGFPGPGQQIPGFPGQQFPAAPGAPTPGGPEPGKPAVTTPSGPTLPLPTGPLKVPCDIPLPCGLLPRLLITIQGAVNRKPKRFVIDLKKGRDIALHINPRFEDWTKIVVRNSMIREQWGAEERQTPNFPFEAGQAFKMQILCEPNGYKVGVNNENLFQFNHRVKDLSEIKGLSFSGDVTISNVTVVMV
ncbi:galectin-3 [Ascaphus truei]|uniref:galectin-3 n=1 Tax=Ascaphus truei TaxID=8439 RepID=UPI003F5AD6DA